VLNISEGLYRGDTEKWSERGNAFVKVTRVCRGPSCPNEGGGKLPKRGDSEDERKKKEQSSTHVSLPIRGPRAKNQGMGADIGFTSVEKKLDPKKSLWEEEREGDHARTCQSALEREDYSSTNCPEKDGRLNIGRALGEKRGGSNWIDLGSVVEALRRCDRNTNNGRGRRLLKRKSLIDQGKSLGRREKNLIEKA